MHIHQNTKRDFYIAQNDTDTDDITDIKNRWADTLHLQPSTPAAQYTY